MAEEENENRKRPVGTRPSADVDEQRNRIDYNRAIEISEAIIRYCAEELPWPTEWDEEMAYIAECLGHRAVDIELRDV
jgi:GrpB-like predicted nucleotidyltransferase (UPF0157 family)